MEVNLLLPNEPEQVIHEIIRLCYERNFIFRCLHGDVASSASIELSPPTLRALVESEYLPKDFQIGGSKDIDIGLDGLTAEGIVDNLESINGKPSVFNLTQIMQMYRGRYQLTPTAHCSPDDRQSLQSKFVSSSSIN